MLCEISTLVPPKPSHALRRFNSDEVASFARFECCPACGSGDREIPCLEFGGTEWTDCLTVSTCGGCGHIYVANPPGPGFIEEFYRLEYSAKDEADLVGTPHRTSGMTPDPKFAPLFDQLAITDPFLRILDVGCGKGQLLRWLESQGFQALTGCEPSLNRYTITGASKAEVILGGFEAVPEDREFDLILSNHVVEHMARPREFAIWAINRLAPGGRLIISVPHPESESDLYKALFLPHLHSFNARSIRALLPDIPSAIFENPDRPGDLTAMFFKDCTPPTNGTWLAQDVSTRTPDQLASALKRPWEESGPNHLALEWRSSSVGTADRSRVGWGHFLVSKLLASVTRKAPAWAGRQMRRSPALGHWSNTGLLRFRRSTDDRSVVRISARGQAVQLTK